MGIKQDLTIGKLKSNLGQKVEIGGSNNLPTLDIKELSQQTFNQMRNTQQEETQKQDDALNINPVITKPTTPQIYKSIPLKVFPLLV